MDKINVETDTHADNRQFPHTALNVNSGRKLPFLTVVPVLTLPVISMASVNYLADSNACLGKQNIATVALSCSAEGQNVRSNGKDSLLTQESKLSTDNIDRDQDNICLGKCSLAKGTKIPLSCLTDGPNFTTCNSNVTHLTSTITTAKPDHTTDIKNLQLKNKVLTTDTITSTESLNKLTKHINFVTESPKQITTTSVYIKSLITAILLKHNLILPCNVYTETKIVPMTQIIDSLVSKGKVDKLKLPPSPLEFKHTLVKFWPMTVKTEWYNCPYELIYSAVRSTGVPNFMSAKIPVPSGLKISHWKELLIGYHD